VRLPLGRCRQCGAITGKRQRWCDAHRPSKYRSRKVQVDGHTFDSVKEARRWQELCLLEQAGAISWLGRQRPFPLVVNGIRVAVYRSDFTYVQDSREVVEDCKSAATRRIGVYVLKKKLMAAIHGIKIQEV
jgi:hypothetical protein